MGIATVIPIILSVLQALPGILDGFKKIFADIAGLFGNLGDAKAAAVTQQASDITGVVENDVGSAKDWFSTEFPTIEALLASPLGKGLPKLLYSASNIMGDNQTTAHVALTAAQMGANSVILAQQAVAK